MNRKHYVILAFIIFIVVFPIIFLVKMDNKKPLEITTPNVRYRLLCSDNAGNKIFGGELPQSAWATRQGVLYIYQGERAGNIYTCSVFSWQRSG